MINTHGKILKSISGVLAFVMVFGLLIYFPTINVSAASKGNGIIENYYTKVYESPEAKLADMELKQVAYGYELYVESVTGEVAFKDVASGNILFTNPYDVATSPSSNSTKDELLSQLVVKYVDNDQEMTFYSSKEAADRSQIVIKNVKNGIRLEYSIGRSETRKLVPRVISAERFEKLIQAYVTDTRQAMKLQVFYSKYDRSALSDRQYAETVINYPALKTMSIYVFDTNASEREINEIEQIIKTYCPHYTYEEMLEDHAECQYEGTDKDPALFKMAIEYYIEEDGLSVRLPANSIRYNETDYQLENIVLLPYMGSGSSDNTGYNFIPDGSGALIRFENIAGTGYTASGKVYGQDYTYNVVGAAHQEVMRLPVYGTVENMNYTITTVTENEVEPEVLDDEGNVVTEAVIEKTTDVQNVSKSRGFLAVIEEGEALTTITSEHGGVLHKYNSIYLTLSPRPKDSYNLAENISIGANTAWTVVSKRKYTGNYKIKYIMLTDDETAAANGITDYYEASYNGMADAYRDYLISRGQIEKLTNIKEDIPLYIESFGSIEKSDTFLSFPITVKVPLTTFDDLKIMTETLAENGITNINYRLTGFTNGGMNFTVPYFVKFEKSVGGNDGFADFVTYAAEKDIGVYADFDFVYNHSSSWFDGFSYRTDAAKTINGTYATMRTYDAALQRFTRAGLNIISPNVYMKFFKQFSTEMEDYGLTSISVSTLGSDLNSDFDKKDPHNREDAKSYTITLLENLKETYGNVMLDGGNAYAIPYASHVLNIALDSSRYTKADESIPFFGLVFHGYLNYAGTPTNMAGDIDKEMLKIIENGASPYFMLSYENTELLKENKSYSKYYSIGYDIWLEDLIEKYDYLNGALKDVQDSIIVNHEFINGERIPSEAEMAADEAKTEAIRAEIEAADALAAEKAEKAKKLQERKDAEAALDNIPVESPETLPDDAENENNEAIENTETPAENNGEVADVENSAETSESEGEANDTAEVAEDNSETDVEETPEDAAELPEEVIVPEKTTEEKVAEAVEAALGNKYAVTTGSIVRVTYENGVVFTLNYNDFAIVTENGDTIEAFSFIKNKQ